MTMKAKNHRNIPIFIPHLGCPNACVFCNQRSISGKQSFCREDVEREIKEALCTIPKDYSVEIAYFGGSFTGIDRELMIYLLDVAKSFTEHHDPMLAKVEGIRMSTRPDYINEEIMDILARYPVKTIELGLQSMDDEVLTASNRGHNSLDAEKACRLIKERGYGLVGQMMIGLPGSCSESEIRTAQKICDMGSDAARIYPTVTFYDTELACMAERGEYEMLSNEEAIMRAKEVLKVFRSRGVECIRIGLCASDNLGDASLVKGGANHPALGELVMGELYFDDMCELVEAQMPHKATKDKILNFCVPQGELSKAIGQRGKNKSRLEEKYKPMIVEIKEANVPNLVLEMTER